MPTVRGIAGAGAGAGAGGGVRRVGHAVSAGLAERAELHAMVAREHGEAAIHKSNTVPSDSHSLHR